jgi:RNA polymerase sigma factor (sigma-70 family)
MADRELEHLLRELTPRVLGTLERRHGQFEQCEDAVQEALIDAARQWPRAGVPDDPRAWLVTVAGRRLVDAWRSESARRTREQTAFELEPAEAAQTGETDDTLDLLVLCCHPSLSAPSQLALTLRAVGGLTTAEIAAAFLVPEATMAQRISRAKQSIKAAGGSFATDLGDALPARVDVVRQVLYLIFNEGYAASVGERAQRAELTTEAIRLTRMLLAARADLETAGLLSLMLLTDARRAARERAGELIPLAEQDRTLWDTAEIAEGTDLISRTLGTGRAGPYQVQAAIAAVHDEATATAATDWPQIVALYDVLEGLAPGPVVTLNRAVAVAQVDGPLAGLALLGTLDDDARLENTHRVDAVRAHLLELAGDTAGARAAYLRAARRTASVQEQRYLSLRAASLPAPVE